MKAKHTRIEKRVFYALLRNCIVLNVKTLEYLSHQNKHFFTRKQNTLELKREYFTYYYETACLIFVSPAITVFINYSVVS